MAAALVLLGLHLPQPVPVALTAFLILVAPGLGFIHRFGSPDRLVGAVVVVAVSLSTAVLLSTLQLAVDAWQPQVVLALLAALAAALAMSTPESVEP